VFWGGELTSDSCPVPSQPGPNFNNSLPQNAAHHRDAGRTAPSTSCMLIGIPV
jgi:hypothetical protein